MFWINSEQFPFLTPVEIKEQIGVRMNILKKKKGTGIPRTDMLNEEITSLKELWRKITKK